MEVTEIEPDETVKDSGFYFANVSDTQVDIMYQGWYIVRFKKVDGQWFLMRHGAVRTKDIAMNERRQIQLVKGG